MKESISELQSVLRRVRPQLLLLHQLTPPTTQQQRQQHEIVAQNEIDDTIRNSNNEAAVRNELQLEAASELINALATFVWKLDSLWADNNASQNEEQAANDDNTVNNNASSSHAASHEPYNTQWDEEAKALIREGYGMISTISQLSIDESTNDYHHNKSDQSQKHRETMRSMTRSSLLDLLTSVSTSSCRHVLLAFLPHFMPIALLHEGDEQTNSTATENDISELSVISQLLETFQSLIQIDATTLVPFLSTLSNLFGSLSKEEKGDDDDNNIINGQTLEIYSVTEDKSSAYNPRKECFQICISSMSSISEHDLPSLLKSLFTLVRTKEEGRLAMESVRKECNSVCGITASTTIPDPSILSISPKNDEESDPSLMHGYDNNHLVLFIGNVIIQSLLSDELHGSKHLTNGFFAEIQHSLHNQTQLHNDVQTSSTTSSFNNDKSFNCITTLDAIILIALNSHDEYKPLVESIVTSFKTYQALLFFGLVQPLIESWKDDRSANNPNSSLLYGPLSSSLISLLFYMLMVSTMTLPSQTGQIQCTLVDGLLSFHYHDEATTKSAEATRDPNLTYVMTCCRVISNLHLTLDPQNQQKVVNSLLSMVTDSFVRSGTTSAIGFHHQTSRKKASKDDIAAKKGGSLNSHLAASCAACRVLLLICNDHVTSLSQMKGTIIDRLMLLASMSTSPSSPSYGKKTDDSIISYHLFDMNCAIIVSLLQNNEQLSYSDSSRETEAPINGNAASELLILCQKFLFTSGYLSSEDENNISHRIICGIILASRLLRCKVVLRSERATIWNWVMTVITPASSATIPSDALNPVVAQWGLSFLEFASSSIIHDSFHPEITEFVDVKSVCGHSDVFNQVNKMLATAAVIQMEDSLRVPLRHESESNTAFLAYSHVPQKKTSGANNMVICPPYFLNGKQSLRASSSSNINQIAAYVHDLVDRYLELGRIRSSGALTSKSSWNPRGWLLAKTQLPCCLSQPAMELLGMKNDSLELEDEPTNSNVKVNPENWKLLFSSNVSKATLLRSLMEFLSCIIVSISVSCAILRHAHDHFLHEEGQVSEMDDSVSDDAKKLKKKRRKQVEALRKLLQFQVNKVLSMQRVCRNIYQSLSRGFYLAASRQSLSGRAKKMLPNQHNNNVVCDKRRIPLGEVKSFIETIETFLGSRMNRFSSPILWSCMLDDVDDAFLIEAMTKNITMDTVSLSRWQHITTFRIQVIRHLQQCLGDINTTTFDEATLRGLSRVFQLLMSLTPCLSCDFSEDTKEDSGIYLAALYKIMLTAFSVSVTSTSAGRTIIHYALMEIKTNRRHNKAIKHDDVHKNSNNLRLGDLVRRSAAASTDSSCSTTEFTSSAIKLKECLLKQFEKCEDASFSCYIIDLLSILVVTSIESSQSSMADITWKALHSVYHSSSSNVVHLPFMLIEINLIITDLTKSEQCDAERVTVVKDAFSHLLRLSSTLMGTKDFHAKAFYHSLLAHFSSLLIGCVSQSQCLTDIYAALEATIAFAVEGPKHSPSKSLPGLNEKNLPSVFELLLCMNALSLSLAKPFSSKKHRPLNADKTQGPYCEIIWPIKLFGKLLILFKAYHRSFARRVFSNVVKISLFMIKLCDYQLQYCVDWRSSQIGSLAGTGSQDYAAAQLLQPLIDCVGSACVSDITSFCRTIKRELSESNYKNTKSIAGLIYRCQGIKETLQIVCQSQGLRIPRKVDTSGAPSDEKEDFDDTEPDKKRRRTLSPQKSSANCRSPPSRSVLEQLQSSSDSEESNMSEGNSFANSDDDSFGAVGDWAA